MGSTSRLRDGVLSLAADSYITSNGEAEGTTGGDFSRGLNHHFGVRSGPGPSPRASHLRFCAWITSNKAAACLPFAILDLTAGVWTSASHTRAPLASCLRPRRSAPTAQRKFRDKWGQANCARIIRRLGASYRADSSAPCTI